jgi:hypothetical protein
MSKYLLTKDQHKAISDVLRSSCDTIEDFVEEVVSKDIRSVSADTIYEIFSNVFKKDAEAFESYLEDRVTTYFHIRVIADKTISVSASSEEEAIERVSDDLACEEYIFDESHTSVSQHDDDYDVTVRVSTSAVESVEASCEEEAFNQTSVSMYDECYDFLEVEDCEIDFHYYQYSQDDVLQEVA